jgi:hypothetical protein
LHSSENDIVPPVNDGSPLQVFVGRVDVSKMPAFGSDFGSSTLFGFNLELALFRRYLDKDHGFRNKSFGETPERAFIVDKPPNTGHRDENIHYSCDLC